jgi:hypothetical protein
MPLSVTCPACRGVLRVRDDYAGQEMKCPRCNASVAVPPPGPVEVQPADAVTARAPVPERDDNGPRATRACPACGQQIAVAARKCRYCRTWIEDDEDEEYGIGSSYRRCPRCGAGGAQRVIFTFWGSFYGPALLCHVRCPECRCAYNGRTGRSNFIPALAFVLVPLLLILGILGGLAFVLYRTFS